MNRHLKSHYRTFVFGLIALMALTGCEMSDGDLGSTVGPAFNGDAGGASGLSGINVPTEYISNFDSSATVEAIRAGLSPGLQLIDTTFSCYNVDTVDYSQPYTTFTVSGTTYTSTQGNGLIDYDPRYGDFTLDGGAFDGEDFVYLSFDQWGQEFDIEVGNNEYTCFQHGSSLERGFHRFLLNTPELTEYTCRHVTSNDEQIVRFSAGGQYATARGTGRYVYRDIIDSSSSKIDFIGGPLDDETVTYREDPSTGRQEFRISETQAFGIAVGASSTLTYVCGRLRTPRPYKQYGIAAATPVAAPSVPLSGLYYVQDILTSSTDSHLWADYYHFRSDGYVNRRTPSVIGDDCDRTRPNGLNYCMSYTVEGDRLKVTSHRGGTFESPKINLGPNNSIVTINSAYTEAITPSPSTHINGIWLNNRYTSNGCIVLDNCTYSYSETVYRMNTDGQFLRVRSGYGGSTVSLGLGSTSAFSNSSNDSQGYYEIQGNRLLLSFANGDVENLFIYQLSNGDLAIGGSLFIDDSD